MASDLRKGWQTFKKNHPEFEKSKKFKSDVGPQLNKFDKARDEFSALREEMKKKAAEIVATGKSVAAALKGYEAIVKDPTASDKTILKDFKDLDFDTFEATYVVQYDKITLP